MSIAAIRSLGRAGYPVHACSAQADAIGFRSRYVTAHAVCPPYGSGEFVPWLREYVRAQSITCLVPGEPLLFELRPVFDEFSSLLPLSRDEEIVYRGISKHALFDYLADSPNLPPRILGDDTAPLPSREDMAKLGLPLFLKADGSHALVGAESKVFKAATVDEALRQLGDMRGLYSRWLVQGFVPGRGVGAFVLRWNGEVLAEMMHLRLHELPLLGWSSYRKCWWHEAIMADARDKLAALDWQGVAMMEYRWDPDSNRFALIEMNGRLWGSLHLALFAGVDFPRLMIDAFHGQPVSPVSGRDATVRSRSTVLELRYVAALLQDRDRSLGARLWAVPEFFLLMLNPGVKSDLMFPGDWRLFWWQIGQYLRRMLPGGRRA